MERTTWRCEVSQRRRCRRVTSPMKMFLEDTKHHTVLASRKTVVRLQQQRFAAPWRKILKHGHQRGPKVRGVNAIPRLVQGSDAFWFAHRDSTIYGSIVTLVGTLCTGAVRFNYWSSTLYPHSNLGHVAHTTPSTSHTTNTTTTTKTISMITVRTRSSRFFVVLLHLVGVSTHLPSTPGIVGVHPLSIVLETLDPSQLEARETDSRINHRQPHWLQDVLGDQSCLHPMGGFSECGDATLWLVIPKKSSKRQALWRQWITWATEEEETDENTSTSRIRGYALQLYHESHQPFAIMNETSSNSTPYRTSHSPSTSNLSEKECLTRRRKDNQLVLVPCSQDRAWAWHFNEYGILHFKKPRSKSDNYDEKQKKRIKKHGKKTLECLGRNSTNAAILMPCDGLRGASITNSEGRDRVLQIGLVRQATAQSTITANRPSEVPTSQETSAQPVQRPPPSQIDKAHSHATASSSPTYHEKLKGATRMASLSSRKSSPAASETTLSLTYFKKVNPILLANGNIGLAPEKTITSKNAAEVPIANPHHSATRPLISRIQTNPYVNDAVEEKWTDPQTHLVYHTDLCHYLGHNRAEAGRHTLTGVGQFMKTVFNIKVPWSPVSSNQRGRFPCLVVLITISLFLQVYGVAFYVSKRDLLADPIMDNYAGKTTEELRQDSSFFETLRFMTPSSNSLAGTFDRTLFLKTNMQLATDTMRSSLDADWKMLTQEAKDLLIGSSMKSRPASERMMEVIQSPDNPSKCSCAQVAAEEYGADPACCARGTELVFTWRKSGALEVRLNGELIDSFDRPDVAAAIFYEYFRLDDPMSRDFLERVVDGFPMLLGPLAQVKGVSSPAMSASTAGSSSKGSGDQNPLVRAFEGVSGIVVTSATNVAGIVQQSAIEIGSGAVTAAKSMGDAARNLGEEVELRRKLIGKHVTQFAHQALTSIYSGGKDHKAVATIPKWLETMPFDMPPEHRSPTGGKAANGRTFRELSFLARFFGSSDTPNDFAPDEITPMIHPSPNVTHRLFLGMVHLYLLLILVVSFPANLSTRTKLVISRKSKLTGVQPVSSDSDSEGSSTESDNRKRGGMNRAFSPPFGRCKNL
jgi:hypothetical protein